MDNHFYFSASEAAARLGITTASLAVYRCNGTGPKFLKLGDTRRSPVIYRRRDLDEWNRKRNRKKNNTDRAGV